jgi:hypothetical protein
MVRSVPLTGSVSDWEMGVTGKATEKWLPGSVKAGVDGVDAEGEEVDEEVDEAG